MMLRIQHERAGGGPVDLPAYHREFGLTAARLAGASPRAIVMHPGPMNRGVEIDSDVADGPQSVIRPPGGEWPRRAHGRARARRRDAAGADSVSAAPAHRGTIFLEDAAVLEHRAFAGSQFILRLAAPRCAAAATPGSFVHLTCGPDLPMRRPLSIMRANAANGWVEVLYKVVGHGLAELALRRPGETLSCLGPIGRGFTASPARPRLLLIGGGVGIPPMVFFAETLAAGRGGFRPLVLMGSELPFPFDAISSRLPAPGLPAGATPRCRCSRNSACRRGSRACPDSRVATAATSPSWPMPG